MKDMLSNNNVVYICRYHVVFCPKYRRKVLTPCHPPIPRRTVAVVGRACPRVWACVPISARPVASCSIEMRTRHETSNGPGRPFGESWR